MPTINELKTYRKNDGKHLFLWYCHKKVSPYLTKLLLTAHISANQTTILSYLVAIIAGVFLVFGDYWRSLIGVLLYEFCMLLDCCDGEVARFTYKDRKNPRGAFLDEAGHHLVWPYLLACMSFGMFNSHPAIFGVNINYPGYIAFVFGFLASLPYLAVHVLDYMANLCSDQREQDPVLISHKKMKEISFTSRLVNYARGLDEKLNLFDFLILIAAIFNAMWLFLLLNAIIMPVMALTSFIGAFRRLPQLQPD